MIIGITPGDRGTTLPLKAGFLTGADIAIPQPLTLASATVDGALAIPSFPQLPDGVGMLNRAFADQFYFRIWPIPAILDVQNPKRNIPIPFQLWNAFLTTVTLTSIGATGDDGVTIDMLAGEVFTRLALKTVNAIIGDTAPFEIDATYSFDFDMGFTAVRLLAVLADILPYQAENAVIEELMWLTDVQTNYDGSENRIALRMRPRRAFKVDITILNDADRKALYDKIFKTVNLDLYVGSYQYQSLLKVSTVIADNKLYTNTRRADLRAGESVLIVTKQNEQFLYEIDEVFPTYATITTSFSQVIPKGSIVCAAFTGRFPNKTSISMNSISGSVTLSLLLTDSREQVAWPDSGVAVPLFYGKPLLRRNPLADGETPETFDLDLEVFDNETGNPAYTSAWTQPFVEGNRKYLIQTLWEPDELEFWRSFLDAIRGSQKSFYTPTYRHDLVYPEGGTFLQNQIEVEGTEYGTTYFDHEPYRAIEIETDIGTYQLKVSDAEITGGTTVISFVDPIPDDISLAVVNRISYLMLVRLGSDKVTLTHNPTHTMLELALRMAVR